MNYRSPRFSFVQIAPGNEPPECDYSLPIAEDTDIAFQLLANGTPAELAALLSGESELYIVTNDAVLFSEADISDYLLLSFTNVFSVAKTGTGSAVMCWSFGLIGIDAISDGVCFRFAIKTATGDVFISNCFQKTDPDFTSVLNYFGEENSFDFDYCHGCVNTIRVPLHLTQPQLADTENVYLRSDGSRKILSSATSKSFRAKTDHLPFAAHEKIKVALSHDVVEIESGEYSGQLVKDGNYEIDWTNFIDYDVAPARFNAYASPYGAKNDNCAFCGDDDSSSCVRVTKLIASVESMPVECATVLSLNGNTSMIDDGPLPFSVVLSRKASTLTANITGGTPPYHVFFDCVPLGPCSDYFIDAPSQVISGGFTASTYFETEPYAGTTYKFNVAVTDKGGTGTTVYDYFNILACLIPTTEIITSKGAKLICELVPGDLVEDEQGYTEVTDVGEHIVDELVNINKGLLISSVGHRHIVERDGVRMTIVADDLSAGDFFVDRSGKRIEIISLIRMKGHFNVINISTASGTYIANGVLTHNKIQC